MPITKNPANSSNTLGTGRIPDMPQPLPAPPACDNRPAFDNRPACDNRPAFANTTTSPLIRTARLLAALLLPVPLLPATASAACAVTAKATIPLDLSNGAITLPVELNGAAATFILDTGAQRSIVTAAAAQRLALARDPWVGTTMSGIGGSDTRPNANPTSFTLGGIPLARHTLSHDTSLTVAVIPRTHVGTHEIDGLLGRDFLSVFDLDLDLPGRGLTLYQVRNCAGRFLPWSGGYVAIPVTVPAQQAMILPVTLDHTPLRALLDTGSGASLLANPGIIRLGLQPASLAADPADMITGVGPRPVPMRLHRFIALHVGAETLDAPPIWVAPIRLPLFADMLLGVDFLANRRIWLSYATRQIFQAVP
jgi:hypothetical protein